MRTGMGGERLTRAEARNGRGCSPALILTFESMKTMNVPIKDRPALYARMATETVYMLNEFEEIAVRFDPSGDRFVKPKGKDEFKAKDGSKVVADALSDGKEISAAAYQDYS